MGASVRALCGGALRTSRQLAIPLIVFLASAGVALACVAPAAPTTLSTSLSGEGKEGEAITVIEGSKVKDQATLSGENAKKPPARSSTSSTPTAAAKNSSRKPANPNSKKAKFPLQKKRP
jgi:hypothetical protein